jgi:hypothetical protein
MARMTPASAPPGTLVLVLGHPAAPAVLGKLVDAPTTRGERYVDMGGPRPRRVPLRSLRLADGEPYAERDSPAGWS